jgi:hypothetical protein
MESIVAAPGYGGDVNLLLRGPGRETRFLRLDRQGRVSRDQSLTEVVENNGLRHWKDFRTDDDQLILFGAVSTRVNRLNQGFISWIALDDDSAHTRLAPLSDLGLEAARRAGDEDIQHLEHSPAHQPVLLTRLGGKPLAVSQVRRSRRPALQLDEGTDQLLAYTEARDEQQAQRLREARSVQRRTEREETLRQQSAKLAAAIGVSPEQYAAMSNQERKQAMVRDGDFDAIQSMVAEQAAATREMMSAGAPPQDMSSQMASAMAGLQKQLADDPNLTPEMRAQMMAMLTQMGQAAGARAPVQSPASPARPAAQAPILEADAPPADAVVLDASLRGFLEFDAEDGRAMTLVVYDARSRGELLRKHYDDGVIYEYIDFSQFALPLEQISVEYRDAADRVVLNPALVVGDQLDD